LSHHAVEQEYHSLRREALKYSRWIRKEFLLYAMLGLNILLFLALVITRSRAEIFFVVVVYSVFMNFLFILVKWALISDVRLDLDLNRVKEALNGSAWIFLCSIVAFIFVIALSPSPLTSHNIFYSLSIIVVTLGVILESVVFSNIINTGTALLWKIYVSDSNSALAEKLPHLIVKTKTGTIFLGQLYDPLDDKLLVLRKAKIVISGTQEVYETLNKITATMPKEPANYISIPWEEIEALQIIEEGLYTTRSPGIVY